MLMEKANEIDGQEQITEKNDTTVYISNEPIMQSAIDVLSMIGAKTKIILKAKGHSIPNAVAVANIITEKMLKGNSKIEDIILDTESEPGIGEMISTVEITLRKI